MKTLTLAVGVLTLCGGVAWGGASRLPAGQRMTPEWAPVRMPMVAQEGPVNLSDAELVDEIYRRLWHHDEAVDLTHVDIVALGGRVKLRGQAVSVHEKRVIEHVATEVAGRGNVTNELDVPQR